jgi:mono/diheme cytochrome c family protein
MKQGIRIGLWAMLIGGVVIQLVPYGHTHRNPPVVAEPQWDNPQTRTVFMRACGDCHSNETKWPWYSNIAPVSWLVARDVYEGREILNVSEWGQSKEEASESAETIQEGSMPPWFYLLGHPEAKLVGSE